MKQLMIAILIIFSGCSTIRIKYESDVIVEKPVSRGATSQETTIPFVYEKSYDVSGTLQISCWLTSIFYGGACWFYNTLPSEEQIASVTKDANKELKAKLKGSKFEQRNVFVDKTSWDRKKTLVSIKPASTELGTKMATGNYPKNSRSKPSSKSSKKSVPLSLTSNPMNSQDLENSEQENAKKKIKLQKQRIEKERKMLAEKRKKEERERQAKLLAQKRRQEILRKDLKNPLSILGHKVERTQGKYGRNFVGLKLDIKNNGSRRVTAYKISVSLQTKLGTKIGVFQLTSESSSIEPGDVSTDTYNWEDNQFIKDEMYDKLAGVSSENLIVKILAQKVVKD